MVTQQQRLKDIIKINIAPAMKNAGFKKKGNWFSKEGKENTGFLNVMSSQFNDQNDVNFTLEMYVMPHDKRPIYDRAIKSDRIGKLKTGRDSWYNLKPNVNSKELGEEIGRDISDYVLPYFQGGLK